jgi:hypothetical protein
LKVRPKTFFVAKLLFIGSAAIVAAERAAVRYGGFSGVEWIENQWQAWSEPSSIGLESRDDFENDPRFHERLLAIGSEYESYGRLDELVRLAPTNCAGAVPHPGASRAAFSLSDETDSHGRKLYFLFLRQPEKYAYGIHYRDSKQPIGQVIVKEAWQAVPVAIDRKPTSVGQPDDPQSYIPFARNPETGQLYRCGERRGLFIMYKLDPATPGTDEGWVYGTVTPEGRQVTSAGPVSNCANCHRDAVHDRMLGLRHSGL